VPAGTDVLGDQKSVPENSEIRAWNFDSVSSVLWVGASTNVKSMLIFIIL